MYPYRAVRCCISNRAICPRWIPPSVMGIALASDTKDPSATKGRRERELGSALAEFTRPCLHRSWIFIGRNKLEKCSQGKPVAPLILGRWPFNVVSSDVLGGQPHEFADERGGLIGLLEAK